MEDSVMFQQDNNSQSSNFLAVWFDTAKEHTADSRTEFSTHHTGAASLSFSLLDELSTANCSRQPNLSWGDLGLSPLDLGEGQVPPDQPKAVWEQLNSTGLTSE